MTDGSGRAIDLGGGVGVTPIVTARWRTDAAPLFGPVPKLLWAKAVGDEVDEAERLSMASIALAVATPEARLVVDPGPGREPIVDVPALGGFAVDEDGWIALEEAVAAADVVVASNLRATQVGALAALAPTLSGRPLLVAAQRAEWDGAVRVNERVASMVDQDAVARLVEDGLIRALDGAVEVVSGVEVIPTGGVTVGHEVVVVRGRGAGARTFAWFGGLLPRRWFGNPRWITALDDLPLASVARKTELFAHAAEEGWIVIPAHEPEATVGRLVPDRDRFRFDPLAEA